MDRFIDRADAGRRLADVLVARALPLDVVLGLPRGGVPVAYEVALALELPLDIVIVRKIGAPYQSEVAMGALGEGGVVVTEHDVVNALKVSPEEFDEAAAREHRELDRRVRRFRSVRAPLEVTDRSVVVVDDGIATGATARAACLVLRARGAASITVAVPVAPSDVASTLGDVAGEVVSLVRADGSFSVGQWYQNFEQTTDDEVDQVLRRAAERGLAG